MPATVRVPPNFFSLFCFGHLQLFFECYGVTGPLKGRRGRCSPPGTLAFKNQFRATFRQNFFVWVSPHRHFTGVRDRRRTSAHSHSLQIIYIYTYDKNTARIAQGLLLYGCAIARELVFCAIALASLQQLRGLKESPHSWWNSPRYAGHPSISEIHQES